MATHKPRRRPLEDFDQPLYLRVTPGLIKRLDALVDHARRGDPPRVCSRGTLARELLYEAVAAREARDDVAPQVAAGEALNGLLEPNKPEPPADQPQLHDGPREDDGPTAPMTGTDANDKGG